MDDFTKGGRGKQAPYTSTHCRVPEDLKPLVDKLIATYKEIYLNQGQEGATNFLAQMNEKLLSGEKDVTYTDEELRVIAEEILAQKKNARISLTRFIQRTFNRYFVGL